MNQAISDKDRWTILNALREYRRTQEEMRDVFIKNDLDNVVSLTEETMLDIDRLAMQIEQADNIFINGQEA